MYVCVNGTSEARLNRSSSIFCLTSLSTQDYSSGTGSSDFPVGFRSEYHQNRPENAGSDRILEAVFRRPYPVAGSARFRSETEKTGRRTRAPEYCFQDPITSGVFRPVPMIFRPENHWNRRRNYSPGQAGRKVEKTSLK